MRKKPQDISRGALEEIRQATIYGTRPRRKFRQAATRYLIDFAWKRSIERDARALKDMDPFIGDLWLDCVHNESFRSYIDSRRRPLDGRRPLASGTLNRNIAVARRILEPSRALMARRWFKSDVARSGASHPARQERLRPQAVPNRLVRAAFVVRAARSPPAADGPVRCEYRVACAGAVRSEVGMGTAYSGARHTRDQADCVRSSRDCDQEQGGAHRRSQRYRAVHCRGSTRTASGICLHLAQSAGAPRSSYAPDKLWMAGGAPACGGSVRDRR